ncbi:hypothetical protein [Spirochaeta africana]|uniref:Aminoglycoside phosphotransferase domain-containing protein n=1 Tax=Spirochaeta africana (strain ATCC 700263 / DSM 8902 / Z-7692) TaxID=889378 RepID=H9UF69_SPIAZ|nr:hypothetical protein [Spirochaeta africana]AFG36162.1 hypothetical protein Spiaf_0053 [Spirochaeta africana DSM 8902]
MAHSVVQAALQQEFDLPHPPAIVSFAERRLSLFYEFRMDGIEYFLKVRKLPAHREGDLAASAADPAVQREARAEWDALCWLFARTDSPDCAVAFVRPVAWIESLNGIVTERVHGEDLWRIVRDPILPRALRKLDLFEQIGRGLGFLAMRGCSDGAGDGGAAPGSSSTARLQPVQHSVGSPQLDAAIARVMQHYGELDIPACRVMSGVDIRDVVIDERGQAFFMDPGELRDVPIYQPLADFLGTLRNMHRFTVAVPSRRTIAACEAALLNGFFAEVDGDPELLLAFRLQRLPKALRRANKKLNRRRLPGWIRELVRRLHLQPSYHGEIRELLADLERREGTT